MRETLFIDRHRLDFLDREGKPVMTVDLLPVDGLLSELPLEKLVDTLIRHHDSPFVRNGLLKLNAAGVIQGVRWSFWGAP